MLLGLVYRSEMDTRLDSDVRMNKLVLPINTPGRVSINWNNPQWLEGGLRVGVSDVTTLLFNGGWQQWSKFSDNELGFENRVTVIDRNWQDTWHAGAAVAGYKRLK